MECIHDCLEVPLECETCLAINKADDLNADCDLLDDGQANGSCAGADESIGVHKCTLDTEQFCSPPNAPGVPCPGGDGDCPITFPGVCVPTSFLSVGNAVIPLVIAAPGSVDIDCGEIDGNGKAECTCDLQETLELDLNPIGFVCVDPAPGCPAGVVDCDGTEGADIDMRTEHGTGNVCANQEDCVADCAVECGADAPVLPGCEGYCQGGGNHNLACVDDTDCPGGNCPGRDSPNHNAQGTCQCSCASMTGGTPEAGSLKCNLGSAITVETALPCDGADIIIDVGQTCIPITTGTATGEINFYNFAAGTNSTGPVTGTPTPGCVDLATSVTTDTQLVGVVNFLDNSVLGDLDVVVSFTCE